MTVRYMTKNPGKQTNECDNKYGNLFVNSSCEGSQLAQEQSVCRCKFNVCHRGTKKLVSAHYTVRLFVGKKQVFKILTVYELRHYYTFWPTFHNYTKESTYRFHKKATVAFCYGNMHFKRCCEKIWKNQVSLS